MEKVIVIIPQFNNVDLLKNCIATLEKQSNLNFDILVVDNNSTDDTRNYLSQKENIKTILLNENIGFAAGVNKGFEYAIKNEYKYAILLNNDTEVDINFVSSLKSAIEKDPSIFSVSSFMISLKNKNLIDDTGDSYCILGWGFQNCTGQKVNDYIKRKNIFSACGGASIYNLSILNKIGFLDEAHFAYLEDIDLGYRAKIYGYKNIFDENAICYHVGSATSGSKYNSFKVRLSSRNNTYLIYKNMPLLQLIINLPFLLLGTLVKQLFFIKKGFGCDFFFGIIDGIKDFHKLKKVRFKFSNLLNYFKIELELATNTCFYVLDFIKRHV